MSNHDHHDEHHHHDDHHDHALPEGTTFTGHDVLDELGNALGSVADVVYDSQGNDPEYLVVDPGIFRAAHYVPVAGAYLTTDDRLVVPWDKHWVKAAPKASGEHVLTSDDRRILETHYAG